MEFVFLTIIAGTALVDGSYWHPKQVPYVGNSLNSSIDEIKFCDKNICVTDASRMALWMDDTANPCDGIFRYVCGSMLHFQALNERYPFQGLQQILYETINEQRRKVLAEPIKTDDIRSHKIVKSLFQQCVNSRSIKKFGRKQILDFMDSVGGFPIIEGDAWNSTKFNRSKLFVDYPTLMMNFFNLKLGINKTDPNSNLSFVYAKENFWYKAVHVDYNFDLFKDLLQDFGVKVTDQVVQQLTDIKDWMNAFVKKKAALDNEEYNLNTITPIAAYNDFINFNLTNLRVDWKQILVSLLGFEVEDNFLIIARNGEILRALVEHLDAASDRLFANFFHLQILTDFRQVFSLYFLPRYVFIKWGTFNAAQRFEQCTMLIRENLPVAFTSLLVKKYTNKRMIDEAEVIANRTVELITEIVENDEFIPKKHRQIMTKKLKGLKLILGYPEELLEDKNVEEFHKNFKFEGNETFFELFLEAFMFEISQNFKNFIKVDDVSLRRNESMKWTDYTTENELMTPLYEMINENTIYYPSLWFQLPYFDPDRPRYYKDSMFAAFLSFTINTGLNKYMKDNNITSKNGEKNHFDFISVIYEKYAEWDDQNKEDQPLPGFLFSNKQLFWFTLIHKNCVKLQIGFGDDLNGEHHSEAYFRETKAFQKAFGCNLPEQNLTKDELSLHHKRFNEFY